MERSERTHVTVFYELARSPTPDSTIRVNPCSLLLTFVVNVTRVTNHAQRKIYSILIFAFRGTFNFVHANGIEVRAEAGATEYYRSDYREYKPVDYRGIYGKIN